MKTRPFPAPLRLGPPGVLRHAPRMLGHIGSDPGGWLLGLESDRQVITRYQKLGAGERRYL